MKHINKKLITSSDGITQPNPKWIGCPLSLKASLTVEASIGLPVFFFALFLFVFLIQMISKQDEVMWSLTRVAQEASVENACKENELTKSTVYLETKLKNYMNNEKLSFSWKDTKILENEDEIDLVVHYRIPLPVALFSINDVPVVQRVRTRAFVGVESRGKKPKDDCEVYVTETGRVYHLNSECTYLKLSISKVLYQDLNGLRNESGGKYKPCHSCCKNQSFLPNSVIYIANYGDRYHSNRLCSRIKRTVKTMKRSEVGNRLPCSKCGKEN